ncbi:hypothetical protein niasHT_018637 [Heterodera trifolii]|uniref:Metalloendopeptidase n=1 Tax=Heterodera trifolii TaxID=157864 RepID=A0ABD2KZI3_9BILA
MALCGRPQKGNAMPRDRVTTFAPRTFAPPTNKNIFFKYCYQFSTILLNYCAFNNYGTKTKIDEEEWEEEEEEQPRVQIPLSSVDGIWKLCNGKNGIISVENGCTKLLICYQSEMDKNRKIGKRFGVGKGNIGKQKFVECAEEIGEDQWHGLIIAKHQNGMISYESSHGFDDIFDTEQTKETEKYLEINLTKNAEPLGNELQEALSSAAFFDDFMPFVLAFEFGAKFCAENGGTTKLCKEKCLSQTLVTQKTKAPFVSTTKFHRTTPRSVPKTTFGIVPTTEQTFGFVPFVRHVDHFGTNCTNIFFPTEVDKFLLNITITPYDVACKKYQRPLKMRDPEGPPSEKHRYFDACNKVPTEEKCENSEELIGCYKSSKKWPGNSPISEICQKHLEGISGGANANVAGFIVKVCALRNENDLVIESTFNISFSNETCKRSRTFSISLEKITDLKHWMPTFLIEFGTDKWKSAIREKADEKSICEELKTSDGIGNMLNDIEPQMNDGTLAKMIHFVPPSKDTKMLPFFQIERPKFSKFLTNRTKLLPYKNDPNKFNSRDPCDEYGADCVPIRNLLLKIEALENCGKNESKNNSIFEIPKWAPPLPPPMTIKKPSETLICDEDMACDKQTLQEQYNQLREICGLKPEEVENQRKKRQYNAQQKWTESPIKITYDEFAQKPGPEKPGPEKPGPEKPGPEKPGPEKPGPEKPGPEKPGPEKPGPEKPGPEKPGLEKPGLEKPGPEKPGPEKPGLEKPGPEKPGPEKPGPEKPGLEKPGPEKPGPEKPGPEKPGPEKPGPEKPGPEKPGPEKPVPKDGYQKWKDAIEIGVALIMEVTCVRFEFVDDFLDGVNGISIADDTAGGVCGRTLLGRQGGWQTISLAINRCIDFVNMSVVAGHELMHALGFRHEQSRSDARNYVIVRTNDNRQSRIYQNTQNFDFPYDFGSVMHYPSGGDHENGLYDRITLPRFYQQTIGQRERISFKDAAIINRIYCQDSCNGTEDKCQNGGYLNPNDCTKCHCPDGYGGKYCDALEENLSGIPRELMANQSAVLLTTKAKCGGNGPCRCHWRIKPEVGKKARIQFKSLSNLFECTYNCASAYVEVKYRADKRAQGAKLCCPRAFTDMNANEYKNWIEAEKPDTDIVISARLSPKWTVPSTVFELTYESGNIKLINSNKCVNTDNLFAEKRNPGTTGLKCYESVKQQYYECSCHGDKKCLAEEKWAVDAFLCPIIKVNGVQIQGSRQQVFTDPKALRYNWTRIEIHCYKAEGSTVNFWGYSKPATKEIIRVDEIHCLSYKAAGVPERFKSLQVEEQPPVKKLSPSPFLASNASSLIHVFVPFVGHP